MRTLLPLDVRTLLPLGSWGPVGPMLLLKMPTFTEWMVDLRVRGSAQSGVLPYNMGSRTPAKKVLEHGLDSYYLITVF